MEVKAAAPKNSNLRGLNVGPLTDIHISLPAKTLSKLDAIKNDLQVSRSRLINKLIINEHENHQTN